MIRKNNCPYISETYTDTKKYLMLYDFINQSNKCGRQLEFFSDINPKELPDMDQNQHRFLKCHGIMMMFMAYSVKHFIFFLLL